MPTQVQFRRGNEGQNNNFKGAAGEISINTDTNSIRVHNGITTGGFELARDDLSNVGNASISGILTAAQFVGDGSGLTNLVSTGVGVEIRDNISVVGTAATIDFGDNLVVSLAAGVATVTALNTSKWRQSSSGIVTTSNVGIGTTNPEYALHVIGDVRIVGVLTVGNSSVTIDGNTNTINIGTGVTVYGNTGIVSAAALYVNGANISNVSGYASTAGIATVASGLTPTASVNTTGVITASKFVGDGSGLTNLPVSSDFVRTSAGIHTLGNVGVGTTNPTSKLTISGNVNINGVLTYPLDNVRIGNSANGSRITSGSSNVFIGVGAGSSNTTGSDNNFLGITAGYYNTSGNSNNFIGNASGYYNISGCYNNFIGFRAGYDNTAGNNNNFVGTYAGNSNTTGLYNNFFGSSSGLNNTSGVQNNFFGDGSGKYNTTGIYNAFLSSYAGEQNTIGSFNSFIGAFSGNSNTTGCYNNYFGTSSGSFNDTGCYNNFLGSYSGIHTDKSFRVVLGSGFYENFGGYNSYYLDTPKDADKQFAVGLNTTGTAEYWLVGDENFNIGIGTTNPSEKLSVGGNISLNQTTVYGSVQASTASTIATGIHSGLSTSVYRSVEYTIQASQGSNHQAIKILAIHDGTTAYDTQYGNIYNNEVATFDVDISGGNVRLVAVASSTSTTNYTVNFIATKI